MEKQIIFEQYIITSARSCLLIYLPTAKSTEQILITSIKYSIINEQIHVVYSPCKTFIRIKSGFISTLVEPRFSYPLSVECFSTGVRRICILINVEC